MLKHFSDLNRTSPPVASPAFRTELSLLGLKGEPCLLSVSLPSAVLVPTAGPTPLCSGLAAERPGAAFLSVPLLPDSRKTKFCPLFNR